MKTISPMATDGRSAQVQLPSSVRGAGWVAKRAAIGIACLFVFAFGGALLLHASIDQTADANYVADQE